jgi:hypothetical protein
MNPETLAPAPPLGASKTRYAGPVWTLVLLAPLIAELLSGATRLSFLFAFVPEIMVWGCGALICRELVRRSSAGGGSLLLLGLALSVAEEFVIQQTSLAPLPFPGVHADYGRALGVNWLYFLYMLGYESVFVVLVPVAVTELLYPARRSQPWLRTRGFVTTWVVFLLGSVIAWYAWVKRARPSLHAAPYHPPAATLAAGVAAILLLGWAAYAWRGDEQRRAGSAQKTIKSTNPWFPINPWFAGIVAFVLASGWDWLIGLLFTPIRFPAWLPIAGSCAWALVAFLLILRWSKSPGWGEMQRWSLAFGSILAIMSTGYLSTKGWKHADLAFKAILNLLAFALLIRLGVKVRGRTRLPVV